MKDQLKIVLESLRKEVKKNLQSINQNRQTIGLLKESESQGNETKIQVEALYSANKTLLLLNDANLKLQNAINHFISNHQNVLNSNKDKMKIPVPKRDGKIDFFQLTVNGEIPFNEYHPKFNDEKFIQQLLDYYIKNEEYEECSNIQRLKNHKQKV